MVNHTNDDSDGTYLGPTAYKVKLEPLDDEVHVLAVDSLPVDWWAEQCSDTNSNLVEVLVLDN
jgi:hypothetical protein